MKKLFVMLFIAASPSIVLAQFNLNANGNASIGSQPPANSAMLNLNDVNNPYYTIGIQASINTNSSNNIGLASNTHPSSNIDSGRTTGVLGVGGRRASGFNYGVIGALAGTNNGAGIFGTLTNTTGVYVNGQYAGYFDGPTYCSSTITATNFITNSDITLKENILPLRVTATSYFCPYIGEEGIIRYNKQYLGTQQITGGTDIEYYCDRRRRLYRFQFCLLYARETS